MYEVWSGLPKPTKITEYPESGDAKRHLNKLPTTQGSGAHVLKRNPEGAALLACHPKSTPKGRRDLELSFTKRTHPVFAGLPAPTPAEPEAPEVEVEAEPTPPHPEPEGAPEPAEDAPHDDEEPEEPPESEEAAAPAESEPAPATTVAPSNPPPSPQPPSARANAHFVKLVEKGREQFIQQHERVAAARQALEQAELEAAMEFDSTLSRILGRNP